MLQNRAIVTITGKLPKSIGGPQLYQGVAELADTGFARVEIAVPQGVKDFPSTPYMFTVDCESTMCEMRPGKWPLLTVSEWSPLEHYYM